MPKSYPTKLPNSLPVAKLEAVLRRVDAVPFNGKTHRVWRLPIGPLISVPKGRHVEQDELHNILKVAGISREEFFRLLDGETLVPAKWQAPSRTKSTPGKKTFDVPS